MRRSIPALALSYLMVPSVSARSCAQMTLQNAANNADSVFFATLQEAKVVPGDSQDLTTIEGRFLVYKTLKGSAPAQPLLLRTPREDSSCGVEMMVAKRYVIFKRRDTDGIITCDGSGVLGHFGPVSQWDEDEVIAEVQKAVQKTRRQR